MDYTTWNDAAEAAVSDIFSLVRTGTKVDLDSLRRNLDSFISSLFDKPGGKVSAAVKFANLGADAIEVAKSEGYLLVQATTTKTLIGKQRDYGPENISRFGRQGLLVRLHDKVARLENLAARGSAPQNESIHDNFLDVVGYCAIGIMWERGLFLLPLE